MKIRVKFSKTGNLRFLGHLDIMRAFQKMNRRAGIDIAYSGGFSPHQEMSFATPLGVGLTSTGEYVDYTMNSVPSREEFIACLNAASVPELQILDATMLPDDAKNAMALLWAADYTLSFREGHEPADIEGFFRDLFDFLGKSEIKVEKETKKNRVTVDLKSQIRLIERRSDSLFMRIDTGSNSNLKPDFILETFCRETGREFDPLLFTVNRDELYGEEDGKEKKLSEYGERW